MATLVTGGGGHVGAEIVRRLVSRGEKVVVLDIEREPARLRDVSADILCVAGDVGLTGDVFDAVSRNAVDRIFHLGGMLNDPSERRHAASFHANVAGTLNMLEAARIFGVSQFFFASSRGTFGRDSTDVVHNDSIQRPASFYGWGKIYGEGIGRWFGTRFGLDFRSLRFPTVVAPGINAVGHWAPAMIEDALAGRQHLCRFGAPDDVGFFLHVGDAARGAIELMDAPAEAAKARVYNIAGIPEATTAADLERALRDVFPAFRVTYEKKNGKPISYSVFDDSAARSDWGWKPAFGDLDSIIAQFSRDLSAR